MDKLTGAVAINCGALAGGNFPHSFAGRRIPRSD